MSKLKNGCVSPLSGFRIVVKLQQNKFHVQASFIKSILSKILLKEKAKGELSVALVDNQEMAILNEKYRKKKGPTDVLAFPLDFPLLGEIVVAVPTALQQAKAKRHSLLSEISFLLIHGALHLLGYDHHTPAQRNKMLKKQAILFKNAWESLDG